MKNILINTWRNFCPDVDYRVSISTALSKFNGNENVIDSSPIVRASCSKRATATYNRGNAGCRIKRAENGSCDCQWILKELEINIATSLSNFAIPGKKAPQVIDISS